MALTVKEASELLAQYSARMGKVFNEGKLQKAAIADAKAAHADLKVKYDELVANVAAGNIEVPVGMSDSLTALGDSIEAADNLVPDEPPPAPPIDNSPPTPEAPVLSPPTEPAPEVPVESPPTEPAPEAPVDETAPIDPAPTEVPVDAPADSVEPAIPSTESAPEATGDTIPDPNSGSGATIFP